MKILNSALTPQPHPGFFSLHPSAQRGQMEVRHPLWYQVDHPHQAQAHRHVSKTPAADFRGASHTDSWTDVALRGENEAVICE